MSKMFKRCGAGVVVSMLAVAGSAQADMIGITGNVAASAEQTGANYAGTLTYTHLGGSSGSLVINLMNTTPGGVGGFLTGIAFRFPITGNASGANLTTGPSNAWNDIPGGSASPFGNFIGVTSTGGNWEGGGPPSAGIGIGLSGSWTFSIASDNAAALTAGSFITGGNAPSFVVRFRGLNDGGSDKVPGQLVPGPGVMGLAGVAGLMAARRRRA